MAPPKKTDKFDTNNYNDVHASLSRWTAELHRETNKLTRLQKLIAALKKRRQKTKWFVNRRRKQLAKLGSNPIKRTLDAALNHVGETENPAGSNRGPGIVSLCQKTIIGYDGVAWCGCFVGYHLKVIAGLPVTSRMAYTPYIHDDAAAGVNGLKQLVSLEGGVAGDLALFNFGSGGIKHVGFILKYLGGGYYETLEGNTSFDSAGSQSNGGCVAIKKRHVSLIHSIARPAYK